MLRIKSSAKLNLFLHISGRDERNYHILQSLFCIIPNLYDEITFEKKQASCVEVISNENIVDNIILKAAQAIGVNKDIQITLQKNIPIGSGLGGGSSNAAQTLLALNQLFKLNLSQQALIDTKIGDDVEFFLLQKNCVYFDEQKRQNVNLNLKLHLLLVKPNFSLSTPEVYKVFRELVPTSTLQPIKGDIIHNIFHGNNDLYIAAQKVNSDITNVISAIECQKGMIVTRMSGSGSTCFGIFESDESARDAMLNIRNKYPEWFCHICNLQI